MPIVATFSVFAAHHASHSHRQNEGVIKTRLPTAWPGSRPFPSLSSTRRAKFASLATAADRPGSSGGSPKKRQYDPVDQDLLDRIDLQWRGLLESRWLSAEAQGLAGVGDSDIMPPMQKARDKALANSDTRAWCVERCLATGHCEVAEDLWELSTEQVVMFCQECASKDGCELSYEKAETYIDTLGQAAAEETLIRTADWGNEELWD